MGGPSPTLISRSTWRTERPIRSANCLFVRIFFNWRLRSLRVAQSYNHARRDVSDTNQSVSDMNWFMSCCAWGACRQTSFGK